MGNEHKKQLIEAYNNDKYNSVKFNFSLESLLSDIELSPIIHNSYLQTINRYCQYLDQTKFGLFNFKIIFNFTYFKSRK